jgi:hypothetical protein
LDGAVGYQRSEVMMTDISVECYAGYRADQRPLKFTLGDQVFQVEEIEDQWYSPSATYFRILADDGNVYVLRHDEANDRWRLEAFRSGGQTVE